MTECCEDRVLGNCPYCGKEIIGHHGNKMQAHMRFCKKNPRHDEIMKRHAATTLKAAQTEDAQQLRRTHRRAKTDAKYKVYEFVCPKCKKTFSKKWKIADYEAGKVPIFCSQTCANSHVISKETAEKIRKGVSKSYKSRCSRCNSEFMKKGTSRNSLCPKCKKQDAQAICEICGKQFQRKRKEKTCSAACAKILRSQATKRSVKSRIERGTFKGWQTRNCSSYAEKFFMKVLDQNKLKYKREVHVNGYFLDFVIVLDNGLKIDLEIDGSQHEFEDRKASDKRRDHVNRSTGWIVYRIPWNNLNTKKNGCPIGSLRMKAKIKQFLWWLDIMKR